MTTAVKTKVLNATQTRKYGRAFPLKRLLKPEPKTVIPELELIEGMQVLIVGGNDLDFPFTLACLFPSVSFVVVDPSEEITEMGNRKNRYQNLRFRAASYAQLPYESDTFDVAIAVNALRGLLQRVRLIDDIHRILQPGGILYILEGIRGAEYKQKFDKMLRQTKFIRPRRKYLARSAMFCKSYLIIAQK